ncbi:MAG: hypothetical protein ABIN89_29405 [Chitinophagaceae bacterium]
MKKLKLIFFCFFICCLSGCFEINEEFVVKANGSGDLSINMDMSKLVEMMQAFVPPDQMKELEKARDTTIQMKDFVDTASALTPEKKAIMRDGTLRMQMNMADKIFKVNMKYPFKNMADLQKLYLNLGDAGTGMGNMLSSLNPGAQATPTGGREPEMKMISSYFDLETKKNFISRKLNKERYAKLDADTMLQQMKQMGEMGGAGMGEVKMNTSIKLPAAAIKLTGSKAELSTDKKIVILKNNLMDIFAHPEVFEFSVEY